MSRSLLRRQLSCNHHHGHKLATKARMIGMCNRDYAFARTASLLPTSSKSAIAAVLPMVPNSSLPKGSQRNSIGLLPALKVQPPNTWRLRGIDGERSCSLARESANSSP